MTEQALQRSEDHPRPAPPDFGSVPLPTGPKKRGPRGANVVLATEVAPNLNHPLASISPEARSAERIRAIASVLARLLRDRVAASAPLITKDDA
jgi:hypothetical protein